VDVATWKRSEQRSLAHRVINGIVLILIVAVGIGLLVFATLELIELK
jgi:hypothetical protein